MNYPSIRIEGAILSPDVVDRIEDLPGQKPTDFAFDSSTKVKDEIARAWADAQDYWRIFQRKLEALKSGIPATTETRQQWIGPLLGLLGYQLEYQAKGTELNGKNYNISHRTANRANLPVHVIGYREPAGLDRKPEVANVRMSAHAIVQEFLNLDEQLYGLVTNGRILRLLRDSSRLIKLSYLEFDLDRIFTDGLFADFAILYRLLHVSRLPVTTEAAGESLIERYHQDSLDSGARIRAGLSQAVEQAIRDFGNGFLAHPANEQLQTAVASGTLRPEDYYKDLLRLIYRLLFLMVIEERDLVFPSTGTSRQREMYRRYYSVQRLRLLSEHRYLADPKRHDLWLALLSTFRLFEANGPGEKLGLAPLAGDLFRWDAIGLLASCSLGNDVLLRCLRSLSLYEHPETRQLIRVNYGALNVEEFGSVYEGLLEYKPVFLTDASRLEFSFTAGDERAATGSHYTPDDLVQPLIKHSLDHLIADRLKGKNPEAELLDLRVADVACGSGHILLAAARRIATELAVVRTGEEQPSPSAYRVALRDVIRTCIYGVDLNPLAVELCKVALWLEAHNPGQPLNFLDHHIKCGNAIVGFVRRDELDKGVADEAFATMPGDDRDIASAWRRTNRRDRSDIRQIRLAPAIEQQLDGALKEWDILSALPERTPAQIEEKKSRFEKYAESPEAYRLAQIASIPIAQFYIPKTPVNDSSLCSDGQFRRFWNDGLVPQGQGTGTAWAVAHQKRFFHWFLEFPDVIARGGFDCILGNPPYLGNRFLSGRFGDSFLNWVRTEFSPAGAVDLVTYFLRRIFDLTRPGGHMALISTKTIAQGGAREGGLDVALSEGGAITFAMRSVRWPGRAAVDVVLLALHKGPWAGVRELDRRPVLTISSFLDASDTVEEVKALESNKDLSFQGSIVCGEGFVLAPGEAERLLASDSANVNVVRPYLTGDDLNSRVDQQPSRRVINFFDWDEETCRSRYPECFAILEERVKPERTRVDSNGEFVLRRPLPEKWWIYSDKRPRLYRTIGGLQRVLVINRHTKVCAFSWQPVGIVYSDATVVVASDSSALFGILNSSIHGIWAWKYGSTMGSSTLRYTPSKVFETFPLPTPDSYQDTELAKVSDLYHVSRRHLLESLQIGMTKVYNFINNPGLSIEVVMRESRCSLSTAQSSYADILAFRRLQAQLDETVAKVYGWRKEGISLLHDFYELEYLPEDDRTRYTISPAARSDVLSFLLALNHARVEAETVAIPPKQKRTKGLKKKESPILDMFPGE